MIEFKNLNFAYHSPDEKPLSHSLKEINLSIKEGECILFTGSSGCGKSTLLKLINGIIPEFTHGSIDGDLLLKGKSLKNLSVAERSIEIGSVFQNPKSQFFHLNTSDEVCFGAANHRVDLETIEKRLNDTVNLFSIETLMDRNILHLSGGQKQQIACASVRLSKPSIYLLDEPSSNLDAKSIDQLKHILLELKKMGHTILIAEHRLYYALEICERVVYLKKGRIVFDKDREGFMKTCAPKSYGLRAYKASSLEDLSIHYEAHTHDKKGEGLYIDKLHMSFGKKIAVDVKGLGLPKNKVIALVGHNGAGKSTFVRGLVGIEKTKDYKLNGKKAKARDRIKQSYMVMQDVNCQLYSESVLDELVGLTEESETEIAHAKEILTRLDLIDFVDSHPLALSGGQKQRLAIACALFLDKKVLIFDEPTSGLDYENMLRVSSILKELKKQVDCLMVITHDMELIDQCADAIIEIDEGTVKRQLIKKGGI